MTALRSIIEKKVPVKVFMSNGFQMNGILLEEEPEYVVMKEEGLLNNSLLFKNQISTIREMR